MTLQEHQQTELAMVNAARIRGQILLSAKIDIAEGSDSWLSQAEFAIAESCDPQKGE